ncbi:MAG: malto-oligosyltrehalose synthase [Aggregatilineales bacterium]
MSADFEAVSAILDDLLRQPHVPRATYRLQFNADFTFQDAVALVPYLDALGISDLYASPLFKPRSGSTHGYDTVDYGEFNPALGTDADFEALSTALAERDMGLLLDIVPNHMGASTENDWWTDVLKQGPSSPYARYFDIDWQPQNRALDNKVLLPILGNHYGQVLEAGELKIVYWHGDFYVHYYEHQFPMTPETYGRILAEVLECLPDELGNDDAWVPMELASVIRSLDYLPSYTDVEPQSIEIRQREMTIIRWRLLGLFDKSEVFRATMQTALDAINGNSDAPASFDLLDDLLSQQPYRLAYWRAATDEINYRRFFDINDMVALRIEDLQVFKDVHRRTFELLAEGKVNALRIDHPDGLWDPEGYFLNLQQGYLDTALKQRLGNEADFSGQIAARLNLLRDATGQRVEWPLFVLVEKILSESEPLPYSWAVSGTTGYDFMYAVNNLLVNPDSEDAFNALYTDFIGEDITPRELADYTKRLVMRQSLTSELKSRSTELARIVEQNRRYRGFTQNSLAFGLSEIVAGLDIYRTYITGPGVVSERDQTYIDEAIEEAKQRNPLVLSEIFDFLRDTLLMQNFNEFAEEQRGDLREFVMKFQQITGPVMAKSMEDTAFYIYNRLVSLNEVGGHLTRFGLTAGEFHNHNMEKAYPHAMLSTSTHDTKRSEDVRARINVLSEMPDEWRTMVERWAAINADARTTLGETLAPSRNDEYLIYQTLLGTYLASVDDDETFLQRIVDYMHKAINEAKVHSNWINPNKEYAQAITDFITQIWESAAFRESFDVFHGRVAYFGRLNSLIQTMLKLTCPGVPDIYQGTELWDYSLVDPDNRRPVDFESRHALLEGLREPDDRKALAQSLLENAESGAIKLYLIYTVFQYRRQHEALFRDGDYVPVKVGGERAEHICAFIRTYETEAVVIVVPRLLATLMEGETGIPDAGIWGDTRLILPESVAGKRMENILTGEQMDAQQHLNPGQILSVLPIALFKIG